MEEFKKIKKQWDKRGLPPIPESGISNIARRTEYLKRKQRITGVVLVVTIAVLIGFYFYLSAYKNTDLLIGLGLMVGSLALRLLFEYTNSIEKEKLPIYSPMKVFKKRLTAYYTRRKRIHFVLTPVLFTTYVVGFFWLLPLFERNLSQSFYWYILWSSFFVFAGLAILIWTQIKKELQILKHLQK
ncbi:hypothetical protein OQ279_13030 [Salinimicrobium sp. MT39]|uniref:Uncharacterized protein n=1 Tax=Salinimicrobium profundisediminis TaxID=2994553 RepID=A0A9X3CYS5_9FLAO|nr:hypothetical protein [Salinimicrobium profundisediminis]MCX2839073.1 hypothetical protein [Salinimicrobium profundisediminis]